MYLEARISNEPMLGPSVVVTMQHVNPCMCDLLTLNNSQNKKVFNTYLLVFSTETTVNLDPVRVYNNNINLYYYYY